ncbi:MAG TPA: nucleoside-diphosphate kinase [Myxococcales bacterium]|nr:nucleoside-diphosphate kinase [Deltaproteobacteria bacterium]HAA55549.1 nucleoside-diphosphate kinase [Myxococcales bacterium]|tara:strand:+ start:14072 stop:14503 length:432 start_codon:yes stop_codon:yes gene_type:complete
MSTQRTLSIIKPDAFEKNAVGSILKMITDSGLKVVACKTTRMTVKQAEGFYAVHKERPFFGELTAFMSSGPIVVSVLEGEDAVTKYRELMGPTNSNEAPEGTIRQAFGTNIEKNAVHGSDSADNAKIEVDFFFSANELRGLLG